MVSGWAGRYAGDRGGRCVGREVGEWIGMEGGKLVIR